MHDASRPATADPNGVTAAGWTPAAGPEPAWTGAHLVGMLHVVDHALTAEGVPLDMRHRVAQRLLYGEPDPHRVRIICPRCAKPSHHPKDVEHGYCGQCSWWTSDPTLSTPTGTPLLADQSDGEQS